MYSNRERVTLSEWLSFVRRRILYLFSSLSFFVSWTEILPCCSFFSMMAMMIQFNSIHSCCCERNTASASCGVAALGGAWVMIMGRRRLRWRSVVSFVSLSLSFSLSRSRSPAQPLTLILMLEQTAQMSSREWERSPATATATATATHRHGLLCPCERAAFGRPQHRHRHRLCIIPSDTLSSIDRCENIKILIRSLYHSSN